MKIVQWVNNPFADWTINNQIRVVDPNGANIQPAKVADQERQKKECDQTEKRCTSHEQYSRQQIVRWGVQQNGQDQKKTDRNTNRIEGHSDREPEPMDR